MSASQTIGQGTMKWRGEHRETEDSWRQEDRQTDSGQTDRETDKTGRLPSRNSSESAGRHTLAHPLTHSRTLAVLAPRPRPRARPFTHTRTRRARLPPPLSISSARSASDPPPRLQLRRPPSLTLRNQTHQDREEALVMGIKGLSKVIEDNAPGAVSHIDMKACFGRKVAIDASMSIYQFMIAVRQADGQQLTDAAGEVTSHLQGVFYRTIRMCENGIKPVYVFDGKPPQLKSNELKKRGARRDDAEKEAAKAEEAGDVESFDKFSRRTVKVTKEQNDECKRLLKLMGIPYVEAPCEAEAQCAELAKSGKVYAAGSEDMDTLTFGAPVLMRHLTFSEQKKMPVAVYDFKKVLEGLGMDMDQFIDMCILLGCDYCDSIKGIGPTRAVSLIKEHKSIEKVLQTLDGKKYEVPADWPYKDARELFRAPDVTSADGLEFKWEEPDEQGVVDFLVGEKNFNEDRVRATVKKLAKCRTTTVQGRLADYFKPIAKDPAASTAAAGLKRKAPEPAGRGGSGAGKSKKVALGKRK
ncbi:PIN domain-like protein [Zopfochytrium polystomum]|nr:PIN domain-like protein [Zopfochytrium polystomum]